MLLSIQDLCVEFETDEQTVRAVEHVSLDVDRGQVLGLVGESGCGKSATAMSVPRLLPSPPARLTSGRILFDDRDLMKIPLADLRALRGKRIGVIFQDPMTSLSPLHPIGRQLEEVLRLHTDLSAATLRKTAIDWLGRVGIPEPAMRARALPHELSGGMQQRVMIAMALILEPDLVIADEPTTALDVTLQAQALNLMQKLRRSRTGLLFITHDMGVVYQMASHIAVMYAGQIVEQAEAAAFFSAPRHPYARALLNALPSESTRGRRLQAIPGQAPAAGRYPPGCRFHDRCPVARPACATTPPELETRGNRRVRCLFPLS